MISESTSPRSDESLRRNAQGSLGEIKQDRAAERLIEDGKATSPEREAMYDEETLDTPGAVGESGTQGGQTGRENQNPIGQRNV